MFAPVIEFREVNQSKFCSHCGRGKARKLPMDNSSAAATIKLREVDVLQLILDTLGDSVMSLGKLGTTMVTITGNFRLPQYFKSRHGGIKKLVEAHENLFCLDTNHRFNPQVCRTRDSRAQIKRMTTMARFDHHDCSAEKISINDLSLYVPPAKRSEVPTNAPPGFTPKKKTKPKPTRRVPRIHSPPPSIDDLESWRPKAQTARLVKSPPVSPPPITRIPSPPPPVQLPKLPSNRMLEPRREVQQYVPLESALKADASPFQPKYRTLSAAPHRPAEGRLAKPRIEAPRSSPVEAPASVWEQPLPGSILPRFITTPPTPAPHLAILSPRPRYGLWQTHMFMHNVAMHPDAYKISNVV